MPIRRELILGNVKTTMEGIKTVNGFENSIKTVSRDIKIVEFLNSSELPVVFVLGGPEPQEEDTTDLDKSLMEVRIECWIETKKDLSTALNSLIGDIFKAMQQDLGRGTLANDTRMISIEDVDEVSFSEKGRAGALLIWEVEYHHDLLTLN